MANGMSVGSIYATLGLDTATFDGKLAGVHSQLTGLAGKLQSTSASLQETGASLTRSLTIPIMAAQAAIVGAVVNLTKYAEGLHNLSETTGLTTDTLQKLRYVSKVIGLDWEELARTSTMLERKLLGVENDNGLAAESFKRLGIDIHDSTGHMKSMDILYPSVIAKLQEMTNKTERNALASQLFGRNLGAIAPILALSRQEMEKLTAAAFVMTPAQVELARKAQEAFNTLEVKIGGIANKLALVVLPVVMKEIVPFIEHKIIPALENFIRWVSRLIQGFVNLPTPIQVTIGVLAGLAVATGPALSALGNLGMTLLGFVLMGPRLQVFWTWLTGIWGTFATFVNGATTAVALNSDAVVIDNGALLANAALAGADATALYALATASGTATVATTGLGVALAALALPLAVIGAAALTIYSVFLTIKMLVDAIKATWDSIRRFRETQQPGIHKSRADRESEAAAENPTSTASTAMTDAASSDAQAANDKAEAEARRALEVTRASPGFARERAQALADENNALDEVNAKAKDALDKNKITLDITTQIKAIKAKYADTIREIDDREKTAYAQQRESTVSKGSVSGLIDAAIKVADAAKKAADKRIKDAADAANEVIRIAKEAADREIDSIIAVMQKRREEAEERRQQARQAMGFVDVGSLWQMAMVAGVRGSLGKATESTTGTAKDVPQTRELIAIRDQLRKQEQAQWELNSLVRERLGVF